MWEGEGAGGTVSNGARTPIILQPCTPLTSTPPHDLSHVSFLQFPSSVCILQGPVRRPHCYTVAVLGPTTEPLQHAMIGTKQRRHTYIIYYIHTTNKFILDALLRRKHI